MFFLKDELHGRMPLCSFFYRLLRGEGVTLEDMKDYDESLYKRLKWVLDNSVESLDDITFSQDYSVLGVEKNQLLLPGGDKIMLTETNKQ